MKKNKKNYLKYKIFLAGYPKREITLKILTYIFSRIKTSLFYRFFKIGANSFIDHRAVIDGSNFISIGSNCFIHRNAWLAVPLFEAQNTIPFKTLDIYNSVRVDPGCTISAAQGIKIEDDVLIGPNVTILDHIHKYTNSNEPISRQGIKIKGTIIIKKGAWLCANSTIIPQKGLLIIGKNSIVGANTFLNKSLPDFSIAVGTPARIISQK